MTQMLKAMFKTRRLPIFLSLSVLALITTSATIIHYNADFKGEWAFNEQKSKLAEGRFRMNAQKIKVTQEGDAISIERTSNGPNGDPFTSTDKLTFDGKTVEGTGFGNSKKKSTASWSQDGNQMTINSTTLFERDGNTMEIKTVEVWKLIDDGKSLSIDSKTTSQRGESANTFVYDKK